MEVAVLNVCRGGGVALDERAQGKNKHSNKFFSHRAALSTADVDLARGGGNASVFER